ncbi:MAG: hypothetical protein AAF604_22195 [Acidobacteriota bacterium]
MKTTRLLCLVLLIGGLTVPSFAAVERHHVTELDNLQKSHSPLYAGRVVRSYEEVSSAVALPGAWGALRATLGAQGELYVDVATGGPALVKGQPVALVPGKGNDLKLAEFDGLLGRKAEVVDEALIQAAADRFVDQQVALLGVPRNEIRQRNVTQINDDLWIVTYEHYLHGVLVAGSRLSLVIGHGNLLMWGSEDLFAERSGDASLAALDVASAEQFGKDYMGWQGQRDRLVDGPKLVYLSERAGESNLVAGQQSKRHRLVWEMVAQRRGVVGSWLIQVDATSGEVLQFGDINRYGWIRGGIYPKTWTEPEVTRPMPSVDIGGGNFSTVEGLIDGVSPATVPLEGSKVTLRDQCGTPGAPVLAGDPDGNFDFGEGPPNPDGDADCTNNGIGNNGGEHNTHSARSSYYHITRFKEKAVSWLPGNAWVDSAHEVRVNIDNVCNAYWSPPGGFNGFFQEGFYMTLHCFNTGEVGGIFLHEVGHGLDQNDAQGVADGGTGEAYADVVALFGFHDSCNGAGFWDQTCPSYGFPCTTCTGIRDMDYAAHTDGGGSPVTAPFTTTNFANTCPSSFFTVGPCGNSGHCESHVATGAIFDLVTRKMVPTLDEATAWFVAERDWMLGMQIATAAFNCNETTFASDGCSATSWFNAMLAADDDDGNLANGTPNAGFIFEAFDDHNIACGTAGDAANTSSSACTALTAPVLTAAVAGDGESMDLSWPAVAGAQGYTVLKAHDSCDIDYQQVTTVGSGVTSFNDDDVQGDQVYAYRLVAHGTAGTPADDACMSRLSNCEQVFIDASIFTDGFESGDTTRWDATVQ